MLLLVLFQFFLVNGELVEWPDYDCTENEYYNPISLTCNTLITGYSEENGAFQCSAEYSFLYDATNSALETSCVACTVLKPVVSETGTECVSCPGTVNEKVCKCGDSQILVEAQNDGSSESAPQCVTCIDGYRPGARDNFGVARKCVECEFSDCVCKYNAGVCFPGDFQFTDDSTFILELVNGFKSKLLRDNLKGVGTLCGINIDDSRNNLTACQVLTNICALTLSDGGSLLSKTSCSWLQEITKTQLIDANNNFNSRPGWVERVPWQFYDYTVGGGRFRDNSEVLEEEIPQFYTFQKGRNTSMLDIRVISYTLFGTALPIAPLSNQLSLCAKPVLSFGTTLDHSCSFTLSDLRSKDSLFHELYLYVNGGLVPIPVLVENLGSDPNGGTLTRRFFLVDYNIGVEILEPQNVEVYRFTRYASSISLTVTVKEWSQGNIYVPLLRVTYSDTEDAAEKVETKLRVSYNEDGGRLDKDLGIAVAVMGVLGFFYAVVKTIGYRRRNNVVEDCSCQTLSCFILYVCQGLGMLFFWIVTGTSWYYLVIYKGQEAVSLFLPLDDQPYRGILISCFVLIMVSRLCFLYTSTSYDIFFVDWEKPKGKFIPTTTSTKDQESMTTVSIWRTYLLANEWNELHSIRKINPTFQYMAFVFFAEYVGLKYLTTAQPEVFLNPVDVEYVSEFNLLLRVALITATFFAIWVLQRIYNFLYQRFVSDQIQMYIDLCSISNISVIVLSDAVYGYYIHGRAVHGHADADMAEIVTALKREEDNLCSRRGLEPDSEQQTFSMVIPILLRTNYNRITAPLTTRDISYNRNQRNETDKQIAAYTHISRLFASFIERSLDDIDYTIGDKLFLEKLFDMEIREPPPGKGVLYKDGGQSFENVLYYGNEWLLFIWEVILVVMLDYSTTNFTFAALIAWFINEVVIRKFSQWRCGKNLGDKALVDERFLL